MMKKIIFCLAFAFVHSSFAEEIDCSPEGVKFFAQMQQELAPSMESSFQSLEKLGIPLPPYFVKEIPALKKALNTPVTGKTCGEFKEALKKVYAFQERSRKNFEESRGGDSDFVECNAEGVAYFQKMQQFFQTKLGPIAQELEKKDPSGESLKGIDKENFKKILTLKITPETCPEYKAELHKFSPPPPSCTPEEVKKLAQRHRQAKPILEKELRLLEKKLPPDVWEFLSQLPETRMTKKIIAMEVTPETCPQLKEIFFLMKFGEALSKNRF